MRVRTAFREQPCALLIAIHADKSAAAVAQFAAAHQGRPIIVVIAGTDLYPALRLTEAGLRTLQAAHRIVALQGTAVPLLPPQLRAKTRVIVQSAAAPAAARPTDHLAAVVVGHLRAVKNPLLAAQALALLPADSRWQLELIGAALHPELAAAATLAMQQQPRLCWLGPLPRRQALCHLAAAHLAINSSAGEGGASALSEAIAAGTPVLATAIPGNIGLLGDDWPGLYPPGDAAALAALLHRFETDRAFRQLLRARTLALQPLVDPAREREALRQLLAELQIVA